MTDKINKGISADKLNLTELRSGSYMQTRVDNNLPHGAITLQGTITASQFTPPTAITIMDSNGSDFLVKIHRDGLIEYGPNYTPDEAAAKFWTAVYQQGQTMESLRRDKERMAKEVHDAGAMIVKMAEEKQKYEQLALKASAQLAAAHRKGQLDTEEQENYTMLMKDLNGSYPKTSWQSFSTSTSTF